MKIPEARTRLAAVAGKLRTHSHSGVRLAAQEIDEIVAGLYRERHKPLRAAAENHPMDKARADAIRRFNQDNPDASNQAMADHFGVNPGRVSEALAGKWS